MTIAVQKEGLTPPIAHSAEVDVDVSEGPLADQLATAFDRYLAHHDDATLFHDRNWGEAIKAAYGYQPIYFIARRSGAIVGVLGLIDVRSPFFGRSLISTAFTVGGGPIADDPDVLAALTAAARIEGERRNVRYVELRGGTAPGADWPSKSDVYAGYERALAASREEELKAVPRKRRAEIRKGLKAVEEGRALIRHDAELETFYRLYAQSVHALGTPVFSIGYLKALKKAFGPQLFFSTVAVDGAPVFALASFRFRDRVLPYYAGVTPAARAAKAADLGYFELMDHGRETGAAIFDFGRSKIGSPHADYKKSWGFEAVPLSYHYALIGADETPNVNPNNPKFARVSALWKRLPPFAANALGPLLARNLA
ncbi:MAG: FemAB family XrtA/PEP-CTERM system-associated protein [Pseudomonadota bacterium]